MNFFVFLSLIFCLLITSVFADCIDGMDDDKVPPEKIAAFWAGPRVIQTTPQKITRTVGGIIFDSNYDNGSLLDVTSAGPNEYDCTIYTEQGELGSRRYWFRFRMSGVAGRTITLNIDHSVNPRPVVRIGQGDWRRMTADEAPSGSRVVLSFSPEEEEAEVAFFFPLGFSETYHEVARLIEGKVFASTEVIGTSYQGRDMWMVTVTDPNVPDGGKRRMWVHSRAHAGEVTSTHTMLGILEQTTEDTALGRFLRRKCIFNIVPLQNMDGVYLGHTRWDSQGIDPERQWGNPSRIPEVENLYHQVNEFMAGPNPIEVALNLHATQGNYLDTFFFKHVYPSVTVAFEEIQQNYIDDFDRATPLFDNLSPQTSQLNPTVFIESYFWNNWGESVMAMTHEGHFYRRITDQAFITDADYRALGRAQAEALVEYFDLEQAIPLRGWQLY